MTIFVCECGELVELLGERRQAPDCTECGGVMQPLEHSGAIGPALDLADPAQRDAAISGMLAER